MALETEKQLSTSVSHEEETVILGEDEPNRGLSRKLDLTLVPVFALAYLVAYMVPLHPSLGQVVFFANSARIVTISLTPH